MATLLEGSSSLTNSAFVNQLASSSNPDDEKNFPREEYVNKLCELQKQQQERLEVHLPLQSVSELAEAYQVRITNWLCDEREKLIGHTVLVPGSFFPDSAQDEKNKLFKIQFTNYAPEQRWTGLNSKSRGHGAFFFIELNDRLLRAMPIALRGKGPCLPTYLATHGLDTDPPSETSNSNEPAFLRGTKKRKKKPATGEGSKGSIVHKYFRKLPDNDAVKVQFGKTHECLICAGIGDTTLDSRCFKNAGGNLSKHIRRKNENGCEQHQKAYNEIQSKNIMNVVDGQGGFIKKKSLFASFYENFSLFLFWLSQRLSLSAISNRHLKVGIASLNPQHRLFGDAYLKKLIHETARVLHGYIKNDLLETKARLGGRWLGLQVDLWTDANNVHYVCLGATWLDPQTCRRRFETLGSTAFPVPSVTASALKLWVKNTLLQFNLNFDDVILFTADGGEREMLLLLDCPWLICACHNMQRCVVTSIGLTKTSTSTTTNIFGASADDDEEEEDNDTIEEGEEDDLSAQLRDASEWFDQFDIHGKGELDMTFFDELIDHLGLRDVLGDEEIQRQRFFADPTGSGNLKRGSFLGWFAALLEGSAKAGMHHRRARPPPPSRSSFAYHHDFAWKNGSPHHNGTVPTPPVPPTTAASN
mmetsp:Transcript_15972/g.19450  ORF Transcript_15972/g.19450 Transcript_15972/m.19450 type:complete len:643 (-) Transcript_15972:219-2147(-)